MISLGLNLLKQKSSVHPRWHCSRAAQGWLQGCPGRIRPEAMKEDVVLTTTQMSSGPPHALIPEFSPHLSWKPQHPRKACIMVPTAVSSIGQKLRFIHPWKWVGALLHVLWMNTWREVSTTTQIWPTATMFWVMWSMLKISGRKTVWQQQRRLCLETTHLRRAPYAADTEQGAGEKQSLTTRPSSPRGGGRQFSNTYTTCQEGQLQEDPLGH